MISLNNTATLDAYTDALTVATPYAAHLSLSVRNAAVYWQLGHGWPAVQWEDERFQVPGDLERDLSFDAIRFRSAAAGVPARVTASANTALEVGRG